MKFQIIALSILHGFVTNSRISPKRHQQPSVQIYTHNNNRCQMAEYSGIIRLSQVNVWNIRRYLLDIFIFRITSKYYPSNIIFVTFFHTNRIQTKKKSSTCNPDNLDENMIEDINNAVENLNASLICGASFRIVEISYKKYCILHFYGVAYNNSCKILSIPSIVAAFCIYILLHFTLGIK